VSVCVWSEHERERVCDWVKITVETQGTLHTQTHACGRSECVSERS
jgi:hypothetical protein